MGLNIAELHQKAEAGNCVSQGILGACYLYGYEIDRDYDQAFRWLSAAAAQGASRAVLNLAYMYAQGLGTTQNGPEAVRLLTAVAKPDESSDALIARIELARIYSRGQGISLDADEARKWYSAAIALTKEDEDSEELSEARAYIAQAK